ncbi:retrovirus-related pol polyprotein from transposon TNT 1-94 [Tanacetum coccineum]
MKGNHFRGLPTRDRFKFFKMTTPVLLVRKESNTRPPVRPNQFSWVFFLRTKDETSGILKDFIRQIENQLNKKVKTIRCDNGTEFKNRDMIEFCGSKGIKREYSNARTPQQNGVAERKNRTLIEAARTMLADSFLPNTFWAEAVSTACYVLNRVLVTKPQNKTPYELITGKIPIISYIIPFGCHATILNTIDHLGKFDGKSDEGFLVGYSLNSKAFRPVRSENQAYKNAGPKEDNHSAGTQDNIDAENSEMEAEFAQYYFVLPIWSSYTSIVKSSEAKNEGEKPNKSNEKPVNQEDQAFLEELERLKSEARKGMIMMQQKLSGMEVFAQETEELLLQAGAAKTSSTNKVNTASTPVSTDSPYDGLSFSDPTNPDQDDSKIPSIRTFIKILMIGIFTNHLMMMSCKQEVNVTKSSGSKLLKNCCQFKIQKFGILVDYLMGRRQLRQMGLGNKKDEEELNLVYEFEALMKSRFQMSSMGELTFFLGLQVKQKEDGIFISQDKYVAEILKKFDFVSVKTASTPIETQKPLVKDEEASDVDVHLYRSMIGFLMLLDSKPDMDLCSSVHVLVFSGHYQTSASKVLLENH